MNREHAEQFTLALAKLVGGSWRQITLAKRLGVPQSLGLSLSGWVALLNKEVCAVVNDRRGVVVDGDGQDNDATNAVLTAIGKALAQGDGDRLKPQRSGAE